MVPGANQHCTCFDGQHPPRVRCITLTHSQVQQEVVTSSRARRKAESDKRIRWHDCVHDCKQSKASDAMQNHVALGRGTYHGVICHGLFGNLLMPHIGKQAQSW